MRTARAVLSAQLVWSRGLTYIKVGQDHQESTILWSKHVLGGNDDIVEGDVSGSGSRRVRRLDLLGLNAFPSGHEEGSEAALGLEFSIATAFAWLNIPWRRRSAY